MTTREDFERLAQELRNIAYSNSDLTDSERVSCLESEAALRLAARQDQREAQRVSPDATATDASANAEAASHQTSQKQDMADRMEETTRQPASASSPAPVEAPTREEVERAVTSLAHSSIQTPTGNTVAIMLRRLWAALERINRVAATKTVENWLKLSDDDKRKWFAAILSIDSQRTKIIRQLEDKLEAAEQRVRELEQDAERYRYTRRVGGCTFIFTPENGDEPFRAMNEYYDAAIDAARAEAKGGDKQ